MLFPSLKLLWDVHLFLPAFTHHPDKNKKPRLTTGFGLDSLD